MLEWTNRARSDPQYEMARCGAKCGEGACYVPAAPLMWNERLNRAARFHSDEQLRQGYFAHDSQCTVVPGIDGLYPSTCDGSASCACVGGTKTCSGKCTTWSARIELFGIPAGAEVVSGSSEPDTAFYSWLFESFAGTQCVYVVGPPTNGHRWQLLTGTGQVGFGAGAGPSVGDFSSGGTIASIPSVAHYPRQSASVAVWANWYAAGAPSETVVNVDGTCSPMSLARGTATNGAYTATLTNVATGCHRYVVRFKSAGGTVTYPTTGSLGIGPAGTCADWDPTTPAFGSGCDGGGADAGVDAGGIVDAGGSADASGADSGSDSGATDSGATDSGTSFDSGGAPADAATDDGAAPGDAARDASGPPSRPADPPAVGPDGSSRSPDASSGADADDEEASGCDCRTTESPTGGVALTTLVCALVLARRRSRRR